MAFILLSPMRPHTDTQISSIMTNSADDSIPCARAMLAEYERAERLDARTTNESCICIINDVPSITIRPRVRDTCFASQRLVLQNGPFIRFVIQLPCLMGVINVGTFNFFLIYYNLLVFILTAFDGSASIDIAANWESTDSRAVNHHSTSR